MLGIFASFRNGNFRQTSAQYNSGTSVAAKNPSRAELMERARLGDKEAFQALFAEIGPVVTRYLRRFVTDHAELEDICQEVLIAVFRSRHTYDSTRPFEPWFFAIARKVSAGHFRRGLRQTGLQIQTESREEVRVGDSSALAFDLRQALDRLPASQFEALKLTKGLGLSIEEASERAGTTVGSMKVRVHRAYESLKKVLMR